jgi:hypothetical protein
VFFSGGFVLVFCQCFERIVLLLPGVMTMSMPRKKLEYKKPKKLSKIGEFMKRYPKGIGTIVDMRAVMK